ncbi:hypothetical protein PF004_g25281 [Phytophthora fragariae]|uniref:Uncharacterized protein n=1 Tax=Phytophthora fragariae TaxID=53985 RepID=A0A6G0MS12_9STRA|nr:hypothetical protein PF004_g25281 [Phytophthora fragariae]
MRRQLWQEGRQEGCPKEATPKPKKGVEFFDVSGLLANPEKLQLTFDHFVQAVVPFMNEVDAIGCFDARGFLFAPYLFALFQTRVCMLRKPDKMPSVSDTIEYFKGYKCDNSET